MTNLVRLCALALMAAFSLGTVAASAQEQSTWERIQTTKKLRLGAPVSEPFHFKDSSGSDAPGAVKSGNTVWRGLTPNVAKRLAEALGVELEIVETTYGTAVAGLQANQFDMIMAFDATPERAAAIDFISSSPFYYGTAVVAKEGVDISTWAAINRPDFKMGVNVGTTNAADVMKNAPKASISNFQSVPEMIAAFQSGRVDGIALVLTSMIMASSRLPGTKVEMPTPTKVFPVGTAIRKEADPRWRNFLSTSVAYLSNSGFIEAALKEAYAFRGVDTSKLPPLVTK